MGRHCATQLQISRNRAAYADATIWLKRHSNIEGVQCQLLELISGRVFLAEIRSICQRLVGIREVISSGNGVKINQLTGATATFEL